MATTDAQAPAGFYQLPQWPGERYWDGTAWTDEYRKAPWTEVRLKGPYDWGAREYVIPAICCACGSPAGSGVLVKGNTDAGKVFAQYRFPLCDRCAAIHEQGSPGIFAKHEEKEAWKARKEEWERVDDAVSFKFDQEGFKAKFRFRNRLFAEAFTELNRERPKEEQHEELLLRQIGAHGKLVSHTASDCAISPDGAWIVSASWDRTLKTWDAGTGTELRTMHGHKRQVNACAVGPDGSWIVSASNDKTLRMWDAGTGEELRTMTGHGDYVGACAVSPDGAWIVSGSNDKTLRIWDTRTGAELGTLTGHEHWVTACAVSPDGAWIVSASWDKTLRIWDARSGAELRTLRGHEREVNACAVSPDGAWIVSASSDKTLRTWDAASGGELHTLALGKGVDACAVSPDGTWLVAASGDPDPLSVWDPATGVQLRSFGQPLGMFAVASPVYACAVSPDGQWLVTSDLDGKLKIWDASSFRSLRGA